MPRDATMTRGKPSAGHTRRCTYGSPIPTLRDGHLHGTAAVPYDHGTAARAYLAAGRNVAARLTVCLSAALPLLLLADGGCGECPRSPLPPEAYPWAGPAARPASPRLGMTLDPPTTPCYRHRRGGCHRHRRDGGGLCPRPRLLCPGLGPKVPAPADPEREGGGRSRGTGPRNSAPRPPECAY